MEDVAISEKVVNEEKGDVEEVKKIEFNVNAKEFVPLLCHEEPDNRTENGDPQSPVRTVITKKIGDNYKPVFMDGLTERFINGSGGGEGVGGGGGGVPNPLLPPPPPHHHPIPGVAGVGTGGGGGAPYLLPPPPPPPPHHHHPLTGSNGVREPEIPFIRYYSKSQAIDFFNKKYFSAEPNGEISYRPNLGSLAPGDPDDVIPPSAASTNGGGGGGQKPFFDNSYFQSNIFRPPIIDFLVQDIMYRQYLASSRPKHHSLTSGVHGAGGGNGNNAPRRRQFSSYPRSRSSPKANNNNNNDEESVTNKEEDVTTNKNETQETAESPPSTQQSKSDLSPEIKKTSVTEEVWEEDPPDSPKEQRTAKPRKPTYKFTPPGIMTEGLPPTNGRQKPKELERNFKNNEEKNKAHGDCLNDTLKQSDNLKIAVNITRINSVKRDENIHENSIVEEKKTTECKTLTAEP